MIQAAAIKIYVDKTKKEAIICGLRHHSIIRQLKLLGFEPGIGYRIVDQGFITDKGVFLNRKDALQHAIECKQPMMFRDESSSELFSEDLWQ